MKLKVAIIEDYGGGLRLFKHKRRSKYVIKNVR